MGVVRRLGYSLLRIGRGIVESLRFFTGNRRALIGLVILTFFVLMATVGPVVVPLDLTSRYGERFQLPSLQHPLGTDYAGRDIWAQLVHGSRDVMITAFLAALFAVAVGVILGSLAGMRGGWVDMLLMRATDIMLTVPSFPIMMIFAVMLRVKDPVSIGAILAIWAWPGLARAIRSETLSLREREFIEACRILGLPTRHILFRELVPNLMPLIFINFIRMMRGALTASVGLMYLGIIPYSPTNWGMMFNMAIFQTGAIYVPRALPYLLAPMGSIVLFQYGGLCLAHAIEEMFEPRLRAHE